MTNQAEDMAQERGPRLTPYELVFRAEVFEEQRFPAIREEMENREVKPGDPDRFLMLGEVGSLLQDLLPDDAPGTAVEEYGWLLFHAFHFWHFGRPLYLLEAGLARTLAERPPHVGDWELTAPAPAGYLQLPRHLFWSRVEEDATPEPVDGLFWSLVGTDDPAVPPYRRLDVLLSMGLRPGRPGLSIVRIAEDLRGHPQGHWADADARPEGHDFENILPGGEMEALHAFETPMEVLKLLSLVLWYTAKHPDAVAEPETPPEEAAQTTPHALPPSTLPFHRIQRVGDHG